MIGPYKYTIAALALVAAGGAVLWYGSSRYTQGFEAAKVQMERLAQQEAKRLQEARDAAEFKWRQAEMERESAQKLVDDQRGRIDGLLNDLARKARSATPAGTTNGARATGVGLLTACVREYDAMGSNAARLADKVNGLQEYVRAITTKDQ